MAITRRAEQAQPRPTRLANARSRSSLGYDLDWSRQSPVVPSRRARRRGGRSPSIRIPSCPTTGHFPAGRSDAAPRRAFSFHRGQAWHGHGRSSFHPAAPRAAAEPFPPPSGRALTTRPDISFHPARPGPAPGVFIPNRGRAWIVTMAITRRAEQAQPRPTRLANARSRSSLGYSSWPPWIVAFAASVQ